ncbi:MAG: hypothetical protein HUJ27_00740 [Rhodobacteraceae bacterium]|nr:hypothetical protein [Paracoccaceae bacterium]
MRWIVALLMVTLHVAPSGVGAQSFLNEGKNVVDMTFMAGEGDFAPGFGYGFYSVPESGVGFYGSFLSPLSFNMPYYDELSVGAFGDPITDRTRLPFAFNIGMTVNVMEPLSLYGGLGIAGSTGEAEQFDSTYTLSYDGYYYVHDPSREDVAINGNVGALLTVGTAAVNAGYHTYFDQGYLGIGFRF